MDVHSCGVNGCESPARWERVSQADADLHPYMCAEHWKMLHQHNWIAAAAYRPLSPVLDLVTADQGSTDASSPSSEAQ